MSFTAYEKSIVWLHLSDLHLCEPKMGWDAHRVLEPLLKDLQFMEKTHGLRPQLMFFTGDAAFGNYGSGPGSSLSEQYQEVERFLSGVRLAFEQPIPKENLFLVPGNHDVDRDEATESLTEWIEKQTDPEKITQLIQRGKKDWQQYMDRLKLYRQFLQDNGYSHLLEDPERLIYAQVREIQGLKIGVGGFNSAWNCCRNLEKGKLWLGGNWQNGFIVKKLKKQKTDLSLALIHHPPGWFVEQEDALIRSQMERDFDFFLHGHEHQGWVNAVNGNHVRIAAAACYERSDQENGYNFVRLNLESGEMEVWLRKYDSSGGGWIPRVIANNTNDHGLWLIKNNHILEKLKSKPVFIESKNPEIEKDSLETTKLNVSNQVRLGVREEIQKLIAKPAIEPVVKAFYKAQPEDRHSIKMEDLLVPLYIEPFPITATIDDWHSAVRDGLAYMAEQRSSQLSQTVKIAKETFEWLLRLAVPDAWVVSKANINDYSPLKPEKNFVERQPFWAEVGKGRLAGIRPFLELDKDNFKVFSPNQVESAELELGLLHEDASTEILKIIWNKLHKTDSQPSDQDWRKQLPNILERRHKDGERYHMTIEYSKFAAISRNKVWHELDKLLEHLGVFVCATDQGEPMLIVPEDDLIVAIREFLLLLRKYS